MRGWLNLVDFYKVSLAARDGFGLYAAATSNCTNYAEASREAPQ